MTHGAAAKTAGSLSVAIVGLGAVAVTWLQGFQATNSCSENIGSVSRQNDGGLAIPCNLVGWLGVFAIALIAILAAAAVVAIRVEQWWVSALALIALLAVPVAVAAAYSSAKLG